MDQLTDEQRAFLAEVGPVRPSGDQTHVQAVNLHVASFLAACQLMGLEPTPSDLAVLGALIGRG